MPRRGGGGGTAGGGKRGSAINVSKPSDPAFLKRFKEQAGYKEKVVTIDDKFPSPSEAGRIPNVEEDDREDREDEKPVIVVLGDGDLSAAEAECEAKAMEESAPPPGTRIMFKKPTTGKRPASKDSNSKNAQESSSGSKKSKKSNDKKKLLSFYEEEELDFN